MMHDDFDFGGGSGGPGGRGRGFFGPGPVGFRAGRGMMEPAILQTLLKKPMHGYEIISTLEENSGGMWRPSPGSIYPTLQLLEEKEFVECKEQHGKKVYHLTAAGNKEAQEGREETERLWQRFENGRDVPDVRRTAHDTFHLMRKIYRKGTDSQRERLTALLMRLHHDVETIAKETK